MRIAPKAAILFSVLAAAPVAAALVLFLPRYGEAVRSSEQRASLVAASEINGLVVSHVDAVLEDARTVAAAVGRASDAEPAKAEVALAAMETVLATRPTIDVARIEVPSRDLSTVIAKGHADKELAPRSTPELRATADRDGVAFRWLDPKKGVVVVSVPRHDEGAEKPKGYLTVPLYLQGLQLDLETLAEARGLDASTQSNILLVDGDKRVIAAVGARGVAAGADGRALPLFQGFSSDPRVARVELQQDFVDPTTKEVAALTLLSVGHYDEGRTLGWLVAIEQPHRIVYARLEATRRLFFLVGGGAVLAGLLLALWSSRAVTRPILALVAQANRIGRREYASVRPATRGADEIGELDQAMVRMAADLDRQEREIERETRTRADLSRFMSPELVDAIVKGEHSLELGGRRVEITVLFADVVAFTPLAEKQPPERAVAILNDLFTLLTEVVFKHEGLVDKFLGDSVMAVWGAPVAHPDHASRALRAAGDMLRFVETAAEIWRQEHGVEIRLAIGVNSGSAIVGNIGSGKRMEYTAIGDTVNVAARLESIARPNQVLVGANTAALAGEDFALRDLGPKKLVGRSEEIHVYELET